jgi:hypothetical protein
LQFTLWHKHFSANCNTITHNQTINHLDTLSSASGLSQHALRYLYTKSTRPS